MIDLWEGFLKMVSILLVLVKHNSSMSKHFPLDIAVIYFYTIFVIIYGK